MPLLVLVFIALIVYGSLFPFTGWTKPAVPLFSFLSPNWAAPLERADLVQNVLVYAPLGLLMVAWLGGRLRFRAALLVATLTGIMVSFVMESIQQFLPARVSSLADLVMNVVGTLLGGLLAAFLTRETFSGTKLLELRDAWFRAGPLPNIGLITVGLWILSQTSPLVPSLDVAHLRHGLSLLGHSLKDPQNLNIAQTSTYALYITGLGLLASTHRQPGKPVIGLFLTLVALVLACKVAVVGRQLSLEAVMGAIVATLLLVPLQRMASRIVAVTGIVLIAAGFALSELGARPGLPTYPFNWIPFIGQMSSISGLENIIEIFWPFLAIACFARHATSPCRREKVAFFGGISVVAALSFLEWHQQILPGRVGDITQVLLGFAGWMLPWCIGHEDYINRPLASNSTQT